MTFDPQELTQAILGAQKEPEDTPNSITTTELRRICGVGERKARDFIRQAIAEGVLRPEMISRKVLSGVRQTVQGYVLVEK